MNIRKCGPEYASAYERNRYHHDVCVDCKHMKPIQARGRCPRCYRAWRAAGAENTCIKRSLDIITSALDLSMHPLWNK